MRCERRSRGRRRRQTGQRGGPREGDCGESLRADALVVPTDVCSHSGDEEGQVGFEASAAGGDVVAELMDEDGEGEAEAETPAEERPVDAEEGEEAEQELELEDGEEEGLGLEQEEGDGSEGTEALGPSRLGVIFFAETGIDLGDVAPDGFGLGGSGGKPREGLLPGGAGGGPLGGLLALGGDLGHAMEVTSVDEGLAVRAGERSVRDPVTALGAVVDWLGCSKGADRLTRVFGLRVGLKVQLVHYLFDSAGAGTMHWRVRPGRLCSPYPWRRLGRRGYPCVYGHGRR